MRKLLVLMLVLGMASFALATPTITVSNSNPAPGDTIQLYVTGTTADASVSGGQPGGWSGLIGMDYANYASGGNPYMDFASFTPIIDTEAGSMASAVSSYGLAAITAGAGVPWSEGTDVDASLWFTYDLDVPTSTLDGTVIPVDLLSGWGTVVSSLDVTVTVIPEPITMALLGLGGLLLRRRK